MLSKSHNSKVLGPNKLYAAIFSISLRFEKNSIFTKLEKINDLMNIFMQGGGKLYDIDYILKPEFC